MASITIRNLDDSVRQRLRIQAAAIGRSMEEEARELLSEGLSRRNRPTNIGMALREMALSVGGVNLELPPRQEVRDPPDFS